jgi:HD-GYP domain-containing protein (c-di-GMP phosphodiesterase class II)
MRADSVNDQDRTKRSPAPDNVVDFFQMRSHMISGDAYSVFDMYVALSTALDLVDPRLGDHHKLTCYIAACLAKELGLSGSEYRHVFASALIHDIGATSLHQRLNILEFDCDTSDDHALMGEAIISCVDPLAELAPNIGDHHVIWNQGAGETHRGREVSRASHIVQLADRVAVLIDRSAPLILLQADGIRRKIESKIGKLFVPELATAFCDLSSRSQFWLGMDSDYLNKSLADLSNFQDTFMSLEEMVELSNVFAFIIDSRSRFTANHSWGVATVAEGLAIAHGLDAGTCTKLKIAGYLHDIGKLSVPSEILNKEGKLTPDERTIMDGHSFYTEKIIGDIRGLDDIGAWAAQHHEMLDGSGYPHGLNADALSTEARLMTIADLFTALIEDRPYRAGMPLQKALAIISEMVDDGKLDGDVMQTLSAHAQDIDELRRSAQVAENEKLDIFWNRANQYLADERT